MKTESSRRRKAAAFCFSVLLAIGVVFSGFAACGFGSPFVNTAYAASYDAEDVQVSQDGVTFTCDFLDDGTAVVTKIVADDGVTTVSVPSSLANNGKDYTVTGVKFPYGTKGSDVEQLILPGYAHERILFLEVGKSQRAYHPWLRYKFQLHLAE